MPPPQVIGASVKDWIYSGSSEGLMLRLCLIKDSKPENFDIDEHLQHMDDFTETVCDNLTEFQTDDK